MANPRPFNISSQHPPAFSARRSVVDDRMHCPGSKPSKQARVSALNPVQDAVEVSFCANLTSPMISTPSWEATLGWPLKLQRGFSLLAVFFALLAQLQRVLVTLGRVGPAWPSTTSGLSSWTLQKLSPLCLSPRCSGKIAGAVGRILLQLPRHADGALEIMARLQRDPRKWRDKALVACDKLRAPFQNIRRFCLWHTYLVLQANPLLVSEP